MSGPRYVFSLVCVFCFSYCFMAKLEICFLELTHFISAPKKKERERELTSVLI